jgi:hypothetical protein
MTIRKAKLRSGYVQIDNRTAQDRRLPLDTMGLLTWLLSLPDDWEIRHSKVRSDWGLGEMKLARMMKELEGAGYALRRKERTESGQIRWYTEIRQHVEDAHGNLLHVTTPQVTSPDPSNPGMDEPSLDNSSPYKGKTVETGISEEPTGSSRYPKDSQTPSSPPRGDRSLFEGEAAPDTSQPAVPEKKNGQYPEAFERFWQAYPRGEQGGPNRRVGKPKALEKWRKASKRVDPEDLVLAAERYAFTLKQTGKLQFTKMPMGWLNQGMYETYLGDEWEQTRKQLKPPKDDSWRYMV